MPAYNQLIKFIEKKYFKIVLCVKNVGMCK